MFGDEIDIDYGEGVVEGDIEDEVEEVDQGDDDEYEEVK